MKDHRPERPVVLVSIQFPVKSSSSANLQVGKVGLPPLNSQRIQNQTQLYLQKLWALSPDLLRVSGELLI